MCSCRLSLPADLSSTGSATLLLLLHSYISSHMQLNINGKFGRCRRSFHHYYFCEVLVKLDFHSKYFCLHSGGIFFILSAETFLSVSWFIRSRCQQSGCCLLWMWRRDVVARNDNHHGDPAPLCQPSSCFLCRPLCNNTPPLSHAHYIFNCISITVSICEVEAAPPNGVHVHRRPVTCLRWTLVVHGWVTSRPVWLSRDWQVMRSSLRLPGAHIRFLPPASALSKHSLTVHIKIAGRVS